MKIRILGTAAAEGWPAIFCGCETCKRARSAGGKNFRSRASVQIGETHKIDFPPDTYYHIIRFDLDLSKLRHLFFTHSHADHFALDQLEYIRPPFAYPDENEHLIIYGNSNVIGAIREKFAGVPMPFELVTLQPYEAVEADDLKFIPIPAVHKPDEQALNYIIQSGSSTVLYASDTGLYDQQTIDFLTKFQFQLIIIECTQGKLNMPSKFHMGFSGVLELRDKLAVGGSVSEETNIVITHFSHNIGMLHNELEAMAEHEGIDVAFDGLLLALRKRH